VFLLFLGVSSVYSQGTVEGVTGGEALLPCIYTEKAIQDFTFLWNDDKLKIVYNVDRAQPDTSNQDSVYNSRTSTFPEKYSEGNFSLLLKNLNLADSGNYSCLIVEVNIIRKVELKVRGMCCVGLLSSSVSNDISLAASISYNPRE